LTRFGLRGTPIRLYGGQQKVRLDDDHPNAITWKRNAARGQIDCFDMEHWIGTLEKNLEKYNRYGSSITGEF
jgi:hypothetical protein